MGTTQVELDRSARPRPAAPEVTPLKIRTLLRPGVARGEPWHWELDPYEGCGVGCTFCQVRLDRRDVAQWQQFERKLGVKANAVEVLVRELRQSSEPSRPIWLGVASEPWQPLEEKFRLTRAVLEALCGFEGLDLRISTRSSLIARDGDLLRELSRKSRVSVAFSIAAHDEKVTRLLEPTAPSPMRRLSAMEALARAGIPVGLWVSPVFPGLDEDELGLRALLTRAANAGARFAGIRPVDFTPAQRENFLTQVTIAYPDLAVRFRRVLGARPPSGEDREALLLQFQRACESLGLAPIGEMTAPRAPVRTAPSQLSLFQP